MSTRRTYLDHNASVPLRPEAREAMVAALDVVGNPSSVHAEGRRARSLVETAREQVAKLVNARPAEVVFTSGATESNNWVLGEGWSTITLCPIEHDSVLTPAHQRGGAVIELPVAADGVVNLAGLTAPTSARAIARRSLLSLQMANNETGVIQPVAEAVALAREAGHAVHTDAVQALGRVAIDFRRLGADFMSLSSHKIGGPKGTGALVVRDGADLRPLIVGGGQERRRRGGTENVAGIAGFGAAAAAAGRDLATIERVRDLRDLMERELLRVTPAAEIVGRTTERLPNTTCVALPGAVAETLVIKLDLAGIAVSAGAACSSGKVGESHVLKAMGLAPAVARGAIRVSLGWTTTEEDIAAFVSAWTAAAAAGAIAA